MKTSRRKFIVTSSVAVSGALLTSQANSASLPELSEQDPIAIALGYKRDAQQVDTAKYPKRQGAQGATQFCDNCALYAATEDGLGTCTAIRGKLVAGRGWCNAWIPKS